jgi:hypothetical protein
MSPGTILDLVDSKEERFMEAKPFKKASVDIEQGWHQVFFKILHHPKGLDSLTESEHVQFNKYINWRFNKTLFRGRRIVRAVKDIREVKDDLRSQIIFYLEVRTNKTHISKEQLLKLSAKKLFDKIDDHAHNYLY